MSHRDPYAVNVAFDDIYGEEAEPAPVRQRARRRDKQRAARAIFQRVSRKRLPGAPPSIVVGADYDPTYRTFEVADRSYRIIGDDVVGEFPLYDSMRNRFAAAVSEPKHVRVDNTESYKAFRDARRKPHVKELEERLSALERALAGHVADDHGGGRLTRLEDAFRAHEFDPYGHDVDILGEAAAKAYAKVKRGGTPIDIPLPPWARGRVECWRDGKEILCTVRLPGADGKERFATSGAPVQKYAEEVLGCAMVEGVGPEEFIEVAPMLIQVIGAGELMLQICGAGRQLAAAAAPVVGQLVSPVDPSAAAMMALLQRCQRGDRMACTEATKMAYSPMWPRLREAGNRLLVAQYDKQMRRAK